MSERTPKRERGYNDFAWLQQQAVDQETLDKVELIEKDERAFVEKGIITEGSEEYELHFKQGTFFTTRATGHSIANIFVHIFKNRGHMLAPGFEVIDEPIILDIGANEGYYAVCMAQRNPHAKIFAIEPNPIAYNLLKKNIKANGTENITALDAAIWSKNGTVELCTLPQVTSIGSVAPIESSFMTSSRERVVKMIVPCKTLREIVRTHKIKKIDLLKIDIEGGELEVLRSSVEILKIVDRIVLEYHNQQIKAELTQLLQKNGFELKMHAPDRAEFGDLYFVRHSVEQQVYYATPKYLSHAVHALYKKAKGVIINS